MPLRLAIVGTGTFAECFIPLFKAHPLVHELSLCDQNPEELAAAAEKFDVRRIFPTLESVCQSDVDAVAIFTQNWTHAALATQALRSGKHVYSSVPPAITLQELRDLVQAVEQTGRIYMLGETSWYYPAVIYCREKFSQGAFGHVVYAEGNYYHDFDDGLYDVFKTRGGQDWGKYAGSPPMHYPTHSISSVLSVTGARLSHVSCQGWVDRHEDGLFRAGVNLWNNVFSNESALFRASDGSIVRINEFRRVGGMNGERSTIVGTLASFENSQTSNTWLAKSKPAEPLNDLLGAGGFAGLSPVHPAGRLPRQFAGLPNGHWGSHQFLVDDFLTNVAAKRHPPIDVWTATRFCAPGIVAHESAKRGGELLEIPDFGR